MLAAAKAHDVQITISSVFVAIANLAQAVGVSSDSVVKVHWSLSSVVGSQSVKLDAVFDPSCLGVGCQQTKQFAQVLDAAVHQHVASGRDSGGVSRSDFIKRFDQFVLLFAVAKIGDVYVGLHGFLSSVEPPERPIEGPLKLFNEPPLPFSCCLACEAQSRLTVPIPERGLRRSDKHQWCAPFGWEVRSFWGKLIVGMEARSTVR
jgi:hypothetical protein